MKWKIFAAVVGLLLLGLILVGCGATPEPCPECPECPEAECPEVECPEAECPECPEVECPECLGYLGRSFCLSFFGFISLSDLDLPVPLSPISGIPMKGRLRYSSL